MHLRTFVLVLLLAGTTAMAAGTPPGPRFPGGAVIPRPEFRVRSVPRQARAGDPGVGLFAAAQPAWWVAASPLSGTVARAFGPGLSLDGDAGDGLAFRGRAWLGRHPELLAVPLGELTAGQVLPGPSAPGAVRWLRFQQRHGSLRVLGASLSMAVGDGKVVFLASRVLGAVTVSTIPLLSTADALEAVRRYSGAADLDLAGVPELALVPRIMEVGVVERLTHDLVWRLEVLAAGDDLMEMHHAWVHARDGRMVAFFPDAVSAACVADPRRAKGSVRGGVRPNRADDQEVDMAFPGAPVSAGRLLLKADAGGRFAFSGSAASSDLQGSRFKMACVDCQQTIPLAFDDGAGRITFGSGGGSSGPAVPGNGTSTPADRTAFFQLEQGRLLLGKWDVDVVPDLRVQVNISNFCNARSGAYWLEFYQEGNGCNNTGEIRDIMQHELGHSWDRFDGNGITNSGMSEWKSDMMALTMGGDACVGESFYAKKAFGPTAACSGVRDLDELAAGRQDLPAAPTADCPTCPTLTRSVRLAVCGSSVHCIGSIAGQAIWHLRNNLLSGDDYVSGLPLPAGNPALSSLQMRWLLERWLLGGGVPMETWDPTAAGVSIYDAVMVADDDDQNLANGTPHAAYINAAFSHHEIDESPQLPDSTNCAAPADPLVSVLVQPGEDGLPRVRIDWLGGGPGTFDVLRRRFSGDTFLPVARGVVAGPVMDEDVSAGESWEYLVQAVSGGGCRMVSPGLNVEAVNVNLPALEVRLLEFRESPGDGDLLVEPGESADLDLEIVEVGGVAGATGVNLLLSSIDPSVAVSQGGPMAWGDVAAGLAVAGPAPFQLRLADDLPCGSQVVVLLQVDAMETCGSTALRLPLAVVCDSAGEAFVRAVPGSLQVVADTGDQDGLADNCELATLSYELENAGGSASGMVTSTVTALDGRSRVVGGGVWQYVGGGAGALSGLLPGESVTAFFSADLAGWDGPGVAPFAVQTVASQSSGVVTVDLETAIEEDPPLYATQSFDFESGSQGWTGDGFALSTSRANSGTQSFHGGTTSASWLCQHLLSPVFRLDPAGGAAVAMQVYADIEPFSSGTWWDRANVHLLEVDTGRHVLLTPQSGRAYTADPAASLVGQLCHVDLEEGWAGNLSPPFAAVSFDLSPWSGREIRIEVNYSSDGGDDREGIYIDDVVFTGAATPPQDSQSDLCGFAPEVSPPGSPVPLGVELNGGDLLLTWEDLGTGFAYNVYSGTVGNWFDHGLAPLACAGSGVTCDGASCSWTSSGLPAGQAYYLVTASRDGRQGPSGFTTAGIPRDPAADSCLP